MTKEDFLKLKKGDLVTLTKTDKSINVFYEYKVGDQFYYDSFYTDDSFYTTYDADSRVEIYQINLLRVNSKSSKELTGARWVMCHFSEDIINFIERLDVIRNNKLESILN
jgi:hypothetical protein